MSGTRGIGDGYAFQRLLWLLVGTVIVPTVLLSLFGVAAIRNQGAAISQEHDRVQGQRLEAAARLLVESLEGLEADVGDRFGACVARPSQPCPIAEMSGVDAAWRWSRGEPLPEALVALGIAESAHLEAPAWFTPADGSAPVCLLAVGDAILGWQLDMAMLQARLDALEGQLSGDVELALVAPRGGPSTNWEDMAARWQEPTRRERLLPWPLTSWRVELDLSDDPTVMALRRTSWLYPVFLVVLVTLVVVGTVVTLVSASREIRLSRLQTDFVSSVSHELRTPLTSIRLFVETLHSGRLRDPDKIAECLDLLSVETDRLEPHDRAGPGLGAHGGRSPSVRVRARGGARSRRRRTARASFAAPALRRIHRSRDSREPSRAAGGS